jgi:hypothetical protein
MYESPLESDPCTRARNARRMLGELARHLRESTEHVGEPRAQALFEVAAGVVEALNAAFSRYERADHP